MRKNVKQQFALRVLSTAALMAMVSSIATAAFAAEYNVAKGSVEIVAAGGEQRITQRDDTGAFVKDENGDIDHRLDSDIILTTKDKATGETETTSNTVTITAEDGNTANVTLRDVDIRQPDSHWSECTDPAPIEIKGNGSTNLELDGNNTVLSGNEKHAGIEKADVNGTGTLTIKDDKNDDGSDKDKDENGNAVGRDTGKLLAGGYKEGAAIGGGAGDLGDTSNITITGGDITAIGGNNGGSGIGGGGRPGGTGSNICIEGNAHVTATSEEGAAIGGGDSGGNSITIKDHAVVDAYGKYGAAIGDGGLNMGNGRPTTITISGNATVHAETAEYGCAIGSGQHYSSDLTINIEENANVTAIGSYGRPAIGNDRCAEGTTTTINITGGTVNAINSYGSDNPSYPNDGTRETGPAIGAKMEDYGGGSGGTCNVNINSSTGDTVVNAYIYGKGSGTAIGSVTPIYTYNDITQRYDFVRLDVVPADSVSYKADGSSHFGERNSAIVNCYNNGIVNKGIVADENEKLALPSTLDDYANGYNQHRYRHEITGGTLTKVVHNRKYMEEDPKIDTSKLKDEDLHDWKLVGKVVEPTTEKDGYADYICSIDKCGQTKHVVLPKIVPDTPSTPDTPDTPNTPDKPSTPDTPSTPDVPSTPEVTPADPAVTPDVPAQDGTAPADTPAADTTATAQNVAQNAEPKAAAAAPATLPQTGANWLAVVGSALSGLFLLAAGFVLDRKNRRMN